MDIDAGVKQREGRVWAFAAVMIRNQFHIGFADLGQAGYTPAFIPSLPKGFDTYAKASEFADKMNAARGLHSDDAVAIIVDTMQRSNSQQERANGVQRVKLDQRSRDTVLAALRYYQHEFPFGRTTSGAFSVSEHDRAIAEIANGDHDSAFDADEIDSLCDEINAN